MADLFNLDRELLDDNDDLQEDSAEQAEDWDDTNATVDREEEEIVELPDELRRAATSKHQQQQKDDDPALDWDDFVKSSSQAQHDLHDLPYTRLYTAWAQECQSPELRPLDQAVLMELRAAVAAAEDDENDDDNNDNNNNNVDVQMLFRSLQHIDLQRVKFLLADLLQRRLQKIQAHPLYMRNLTERMSQAEVRVCVCCVFLLIYLLLLFVYLCIHSIGTEIPRYCISLPYYYVFQGCIFARLRPSRRTPLPSHRHGPLSARRLETTGQTRHGGRARPGQVCLFARFGGWCCHG